MGEILFVKYGYWVMTLILSFPTENICNKFGYFSFQLMFDFDKFFPCYLLISLKGKQIQQATKEKVKG